LGKNWILLRGLARESAHWGAFVPLLQSTFPDAQVTLLDLPGTGCFYRETSPNTIKAITGRVRRHALDKGFIQQPATILALSLGAMVALGVDAQLPGRYLWRNPHEYQLCRFESLLSTATLAKL
jgi:pimeloyl-ACP methyl ester carboxylesterase